MAYSRFGNRNGFGTQIQNGVFRNSNPMIEAALDNVPKSPDHIPGKIHSVVMFTGMGNTEYVTLADGEPMRVITRKPLANYTEDDKRDFAERGIELEDNLVWLNNLFALDYTEAEHPQYGGGGNAGQCIRRHYASGFVVTFANSTLIQLLEQVSVRRATGVTQERYARESYTETMRKRTASAISAAVSASQVGPVLAAGEHLDEVTGEISELSERPY